MCVGAGHASCTAATRDVHDNQAGAAARLRRQQPSAAPPTSIAAMIDEAAERAAFTCVADGRSPFVPLRQAVAGESCGGGAVPSEPAAPSGPRRGQRRPATILELQRRIARGASSPAVFLCNV